MYASGTMSRSVESVKRDISDILQSGKFYCNEEIAREFTSISNGLNHLKLDDKLITTSPTWKGSKGFEATATAPYIAASLGKLGSFMNEYKHQMELQKVSHQQENQIRELNQWAVTNLRNIQQDMMPSAASAADRIRQFGDHVGVTDRFTGYRNNLTRVARDTDPSMFAGFPRSYTTMGSPTLEQKTKFGQRTAQNYGEMGKKVTFGSSWPAQWTLRGYRTLDSLYPRATSKSAEGKFRPSTIMADVRAMNALNAQSMSSGQHHQQDTQSATLMTKPPSTMSVQEQAGINTKFPGKTEYMSRYNRQVTTGPTGDFIINPTPDLGIYGRPLRSATFYPNSTEHQARYVWPDGNNIVRLPWLRK